MNGRNGPLSPVSVGGSSEWSGIDRYGNDTESQYSPNPNSRGQIASPPMSNGSDTMNGGRFPPRNPSGPSPPASIARSSTGTNGLYNGSESGRNKRDEQFEGMLSEHYVSLKRYLAASLRDKGNPRPNKAQDKLLRLSPVQFQELSTDVFDELQRRQASARRTPNGSASNTPAFLQPEKNFHPKRNQARQKLSSLPPPRFRDLATDVYYELERRFPRFTAGDISRIGSPQSIRGPPSRSGTGTPGPDGRGSRRRPSDATSIASYGPRSDSRNGGPMMPSALNLPPSPALPLNDYGRPTPKTFQQNTIVPNKSTMVEEDDDDGAEDEEGEDIDNDDAFGLESAARDMAMDINRKDSVDSGAAGSETDKKLLEDSQSQVAELREKLDAMEDKMREKDDELNNIINGERDRSTALNLEKKEWDDLRMNLENKLADAQNKLADAEALNGNLQQELDRVRAESMNRDREMDELRRELEALRTNGGSAKAIGVNGGSFSNGLNDTELERENQELRRDLEEQQEVTEEVRKEAQEFLREMRVLSEQGGASWQRQEELEERNNRLEAEVKDWRNRYARTKTQLRSIRASSIGLTIQQDAAKYAKDSGFTEENGMVKDVHVTKFQISIDELLQTARKDNPDRATDFMKDVVSNVRQITQDIEENGNNLTPQQTKLKSRVSATANNLITASKNFAAAGGLSPVSLLDAAASHLTAAVVELVRTVKIRPTPAGELEDDDDGSLQVMDSTGFFPVSGGGRSEANGSGSINGNPNVIENGNAQPYMGMGNARMSAESLYSPVNSPRESAALGRPKSSSKESWREKRPSVRLNGMSKNLAPSPMAFGIRQQNSDIEDLKIYLEDQTALLVQNIQGLVGSIRSESTITVLTSQITSIANVVSKIITSTEKAIQDTGNAELRDQGLPVIERLEAVQRRLVEAGEEGEDLDGAGDGFRRWAGGLPPIAFEIARETKELVQRVDNVDVALINSGNVSGDEDFS